MGIAWDPQRQLANTTMNTFLFFSTLIAFSRAATVGVVPGAAIVGNAAPYLVRAPAHDSASIEHHRLGGNFAYSTAEAHAFAEVIPQISTLTHPVAETTHTHIPAHLQEHPYLRNPGYQRTRPYPPDCPPANCSRNPHPHRSGCFPGCGHPSSRCCPCPSCRRSRCPSCSCCLCCCPCCCWICWSWIWSRSWICWSCPWSHRRCPSRCCLSSGYQNFHQYLKVILSGLYRSCAVSDFLRHTQLYNRKVGVSWSLFLVLLRITSNVSNALQYDVTTSITSGLFLLLNVLYIRYRRELFINKSVPFL